MLSVFNGEKFFSTKTGMKIRFGQSGERKAGVANLAFTLVEVLVSFAIIMMTVGGLLYGYVQTNRLTEWSAMSLAAQSVAAQGMEMARGAMWEPRLLLGVTNTGVGTYDEMPVPGGGIYTVKFICLLDVPSGGAPLTTNGMGGVVTNFTYAVTNTITITNVFGSAPWVRQIRSDCVWKFPRTGEWFTNTVLSLRAADEQ
jgi:type II secretory pathway pseudopilin PulG